MKQVLTLIFLSLIIASCSSSKQYTYLDDVPIRERELREKYHRKYEKFKVSAENLPSFQKVSINKFQSKFVLIDQDEMRLELTLGQRWSSGQPGVFRSESRYLLTNKKKIVASAESTLALQDIGRSSEIELFYDSNTGTYFIAEEQSWATFRYVIIQPSSNRLDVIASDRWVWNVKYVDIPLPGSINPPGGLPNILGVHCEHIYIKVGDHIYAFPLSSLPEITNLEYSIG